MVGDTSAEGAAEESAGRGDLVCTKQLARAESLHRAGYLAIDNNASERALRNVVGRKNWLFADSDAGGHWAASAYTFIEPAKRCGANPWTWLRDVVRRIATTPNQPATRQLAQTAIVATEQVREPSTHPVKVYFVEQIPFKRACRTASSVRTIASRQVTPKHET